MQADMTLASEVAHALTLGYYSNSAENFSGYVVLQTNAIPSVDDGTISDETTASYLRATFGEDLSGLLLKYDGWETGVEMLEIAQNTAYPGSVKDSIYVSTVGTEELLNDVQTCVSALAGLFGASYDAQALAGNLSSNYQSVLTNAGYNAEDNWDGVDSTVLTNAIVFGLASQCQGDAGTEIANKFADMDEPLLFTTEINANTSLEDLAAWYAAAEAYTVWANDETLNQSFTAVEDYLANPDGIVSKDEVMTQMSNLQSALVTNLTENEGNFEYWTSGQALKDGQSYVSIMQAVDQLSGDYKDSLDSSNLFTEGDVRNQLDNYITAAALMPMIPSNISLGDSCIVVLITNADAQILPKA